MDYEGQICHPPMERSSVNIPITVGCSYNACKFCDLFRHLKYRALSMEEIEKELARIRGLGGDPKVVFLGDGDAFFLKAEELLAIAEKIHAYFPSCTQLRMDARVPNVTEKTDAELKALAEAGVQCLYLGVESGLDDVLRFMNKDHTVAEAEAQIARLHEAGIEYGAHIMTGVAGAGRGQENAESTAAFLNRTKPWKVVNFSMGLHPNVPLAEEIEAGRFTPSDELEILQEEFRILELLEGPLEYDGLHDVFEFRVRGWLPQDREKMLAHTARAIEAQQGAEKRYSWTSPDWRCYLQTPVIFQDQARQIENPPRY